MNPEQPSPPPDDNNIFLTKVAPPPTPEEKKRAALALTIGLIIGFAVLVVAIFLLLFLGANNAASSYRRNTTTQVGEVVKTMQAIDIDSILNQRDITGSISKIEKLQHDRPRLDSVIFARTLSAAYQDAEDASVQVDAYYAKITAFARELPGLLTFAQSTEDTHDDLIKATAEPPKSSSAAQKIAGSIDELSAQIKDLTVPAALVEPRNSLADAYTELSEGYRDLSSSFTDTASSKAQANRRISNAQRLIEKRSDNSAFAEKVKQYEASLVAESKVLLDRL